MSEILRIKFGRPDRTYKVGERVTGWVMIQSRRGVECKSIRIRRFWRTHGKGNEDKGDAAGTTLHRGPLPDSGPHLFEFDFPAPAGPFTYRGSYLNVDQYVEARVDLPFARDPTVREEYVLLPGKPAAPPPMLLDMPENPIAGVVTPLGGFLGIAAVIIGLSLLLTANPAGFGFMLVAVVLFLPILKKKANARLGKSASARLTSVVVGPGEDVGVEVVVRPPKPVQLNRAVVELTAREICVSGSGSNRRTHRLTVYSGGTSLAGAMVLEGGVAKLLNGSLRIPDDAPPSFKGSANKLLWEAEVRLDIPSWPDWVKKIPLVVWPGEDRLGAGGEVEALPRAGEEAFEETPSVRREPGFPEPEAHVTGPPPWLVEADSYREPEEAGDEDAAPEEVSKAEEPMPATDFVPAAPREAPPRPVAAESELPALVRAINEAGIFGKERDRLIKDLLGKLFEFTLEVQRVDRTIGMYTEADFRDGLTVTGVLAGSDLAVAVYFPNDRNDEVKGWMPGSVRSVRAEVNDWDRLRKRPELLARPFSQLPFRDG
jgi:hypothetical protein